MPPRTRTRPAKANPGDLPNVRAATDALPTQHEAGTRRRRRRKVALVSRRDARALEVKAAGLNHRVRERACVRVRGGLELGRLPGLARAN